jgi:predicted dehydrogenase
MTTRREFLQTTAAAAASATVLSGLTPARADAANDTIRLAVIGVRGRGMSHVNEFAGMKGVAVTHVCDVDSAVVGPAVAAVEKKSGKKPEVVTDLRKILDDKNIDAISIATPNHWHSLATYWACQAGKDVYVEKPLSHNVFEGRRIVEAARRYGRIVQHGTQNRSSGAIRSAVDFMRAGKLGKLTAAVGLCYKPRGSIGLSEGKGKVPATADYDLWLGPAAKADLGRSRFHYDWHWFWDYGNGDIGNQGVHQMDVARWGLGKQELPASVVSLGGRFGYQDDGQTPNTQLTVLDYGDCKLIFEVRGLKTAGALDDIRIGNIFYGTEGVITVGGKHGVQCLMGKSREPVKIPAAAGGRPGGGHFGNFIAAVRSRKVEDLNAEVLEGHLSSALCHLGNISYRLGAPTAFEPKAGGFATDADRVTTEMHESMLAHLADNGVKLAETKYLLGKALKFDAKTERFADAPDADKLLTREYRAPFVVTEKF